MFCNYCGKEIPNDSRVCGYCGMMVHQTNAGNTAPIYTQSNSQYYNAAYNQGVTKSQTGEAGPTDEYMPRHSNRLWSRGTIIAISLVAVALLIFGSLFVGAAKFVHNFGDYGMNEFHHGMQSGRIPGGGGLDEYGRGDDYGYYGDDYGDYDDRMDEFFDQYGDLFGDYFNGGNPGGGNSQNPGNNDKKDSDSDTYKGYGKQDGNTNNNGTTPPPNPFPTDENGNTYDNENYKWPTGDGKFEFYAKSTIPKFESVTGKKLVKTETEGENTYYIYEMDMDAYNKYLDAIKAAGYSQTEFDAKGKDSFVEYSNESQYLIIYLMNSDNQIVIMA